jgi:hypothetical protein
MIYDAAGARCDRHSYQTSLLPSPSHLATISTSVACVYSNLARTIRLSCVRGRTPNLLSSTISLRSRSTYICVGGVLALGLVIWSTSKTIDSAFGVASIESNDRNQNLEFSSSSFMSWLSDTYLNCHGCSLTARMALQCRTLGTPK